MFRNRFKKKETLKCESCGAVHDELPAIGFKAPHHYDVLSEEDKNSIAEISNDFCVIFHPDQTDRFIRAVMTIQINDACENLDYGIWVSVSEKSFDDYKASFKMDVEEKVYFGTICNNIVDYEETTLNLHVNVVTGNIGIRPEVIPHQADHKLVSDWESGITLKEALKRIEGVK